MYRTIRLSFVVLFFFVSVANAQTKAPLNVLEYFLIAPGTYLGSADNAKDRRKIIEIKDLTNGYLKLKGDWDGWGDAVLFRNSNGDKTFGIQTIGCGPACGTETIYFVQYYKGKWLDVTKNVLPEIPENELLRVMKCIDPQLADETVITYYELPRYGKTVKIIDDNAASGEGSILYELTWNGSKFIAKARRNAACKPQ